MTSTSGSPWNVQELDAIFPQTGYEIVRRALVLESLEPLSLAGPDPQNQICSWLSVKFESSQNKLLSFSIPAVLNFHWISPPCFFLLGPTVAQPGLRPTTIPSASPCCPPPHRRLLARDEGGRWNDEIKSIRNDGYNRGWYPLVN